MTDTSTDLIERLTKERDHVDQRAGAAERQRDNEIEELIRLRFWQDRVKEALGLSLYDSADKVIPMIEAVAIRSRTTEEQADD